MGEKKIAVRSMIRASKGKMLISIDLSQAESWIVAFLAQERNMKHALEFGDIHTQTAGSALFFSTVPCLHDWAKRGEEWTCPGCNSVVTKVMRYVGKRYNHASAYRMGPERAAQVINKDSDKSPFFTVTIKESKRFSEAWHKFYNLKTWWAEIEQKMNTTRTITTVYGRQRVFFAQWGQELFKEATAFEPQSTVADHFNGAVQPELGIKGGMREIYKQLVRPYSDHSIINQSHDSCILEVPTTVVPDLAPKAESLLRRPLIIKDEQFTIPTDCEVGERWGEMEKLAA